MTFQKTTVSFAIILFIIAIAILAFTVSQAKPNVDWPPNVQSCPDYWLAADGGPQCIHDSGKCVTGDTCCGALVCRAISGNEDRSVCQAPLPTDANCPAPSDSTKESFLGNKYVSKALGTSGGVKKCIPNFDIDKETGNWGKYCNGLSGSDCRAQVFGGGTKAVDFGILGSNKKKISLYEIIVGKLVLECCLDWYYGSRC